MPRFSITREGAAIGQTSAHGDRIELGSAQSCDICIDDLLISLKQATFVRQAPRSLYQVEPLARIPSLRLNGILVERAMELPDGAVLSIEGYEVKVEYLPGELAPMEVPSPARMVGQAVTNDPPLPSPLEPDLPPPLEVSGATPTPAPTHHVTDDMDRTVFVRRVGQLIATAGPLAGQHWDLKQGETRIGRDRSQNDIVLRFDSDGNVDNSISRRHASLHVQGDRVFVEDLGSAAGTHVNGAAVPAGQRVELQHGSIVEIRSARVSTMIRIELLSALTTAPPPKPIIAPAPAIAAPAPAAQAGPPRHESAVHGGLREDQPIPRRHRREIQSGEDPFAPVAESRNRVNIPVWGWVVGGAGILLLLVIIWLLVF